MDEHLEHSINNIENCVSCHKSGSEHDIERNGEPGSGLNPGEADKMRKMKNKNGDTESKENKEKDAD